MSQFEFLEPLTRLFEPPSLAARILADMHLHAVLPRLGDLVRLDEEARRIASEINLTITFTVRAGPKVYLKFERGHVTAMREGSSDVLLFFASCELLNRMFAGEKVTPIPIKGIHHFKALEKFTKLTDILTKYLKPTPPALEDRAFCSRHVELSLLVGLSACRSIAELDPAAQRVVKNLYDGSIQYSVGDGPNAYVVIHGGEIDVFPGTISNPSTTVEIRDLQLAVDLIASKVDTFAANGVGDIRVSGDLHLADEFNHLFDRVGFFLK